ncbi:MAG: outer membrane beta-barrel protein [Bacteroidota bacterium]
MKILTTIFAIVLVQLAFTQQVQAQEESSKLSFSGSADVYFRSNLTAKNNPAVSAPVPNTAFANRTGFGLGMFNLVGTYETDKVGVVGDLVFGPRGVDAVFGSGAPKNIVNQLYVYWNASETVTLTLGNFNTFLGYEVISPASNFNYSTSYMFSWGPFSHTGLKADFALSEDASLMLGVFNPTDLTEFNPVNTYSYGAQLGYKGVYLNLLYGDQDGTLDEDAALDGETSAGALFQVDLTAGFDVTDDFYVGINATYNSTAQGEEVKGTTIEDVDGDGNSFYGVAGYFQYSTSETFAIGLRGEYFGEGNGGYGIIGAYDPDFNASVFATTLSANVSVGDLTFIPELRFDVASEEGAFENGDLEATNSLGSFLLAAVYSF